MSAPSLAEWVVGTALGVGIVALAPVVVPVALDVLGAALYFPVSLYRKARTMLSFTPAEEAEHRRRGLGAPAPVVEEEPTVLTKFGRMTVAEAEEREARAAEKRAEHEAKRTDPDYWVRKAEGALRFGMPEKVGGYLALARYYRDGEGKA